MKGFLKQGVRSLRETRELEGELRDYFGMEIKLAVVKELPSLEGFTFRELSVVQKFKSRRRQESWLKGRAALKELLKEFVENQDTSCIQFPNSRFSVTHSGNYAVALGVKTGFSLGLGIDLEVSCFPTLASARRFLSREERAWLFSLRQDAQKEELLRIWTVKEALYKANTQCKSFLSDYGFGNLDLDAGLAFLKNTDWRFRYCFFKVDEGFMAIAACFR